MSTQSKQDLARIAARKALEDMSDQDDANITEAAKQDPDALPVDDLFKRKPGRPFAEITKRAVSILLDPFHPARS